MNLRTFAFLLDVNIHAEVADWFRQQGFDLVLVRDLVSADSDDEVVLNLACRERRVVVTHDTDFGRLAMMQGLPVIGCIFLRPGHLEPSFTIGSLEVLMAANLDVDVPFIVAVRRSVDEVSIRVRRLSP